MNMSEIRSKPRTETVLESGYRIDDAKADFSETYELGERGCLLVESKHCATKTFFSILCAASESEIENLQAGPTSQQQTEHVNLVDVVDLCITHCLGSSVLYQTDKSTAVFKVTDNFEQKLNEKRRAEGKPTVERATTTSSMVVGFAGTTTVNAIRNVGTLTAKCLGQIEVKDILCLYREGHLHQHAFFERVYKIVEALQRQPAFKALGKKERNYLTAYPQLYRHDQSNCRHQNAIRFLNGKFPAELRDRKKGKEVYSKYLTMLLSGYFQL